MNKIDVFISTKDMKPGVIYNFSGKLYSICVNCKQLVQINKPILGSLHLCVPPDKRDSV